MAEMSQTQGTWQQDGNSVELNKIIPFPVKYKKKKTYCKAAVVALNLEGLVCAFKFCGCFKPSPAEPKYALPLQTV